MASKPKTTAARTPTSKASTVASRANKTTKGVAKSEPNSPLPVQHTRLSAERSPRTNAPRPAVERRPSKAQTPPEKLQSRVAKATETQSQRSQVQGEIKKANDHIALLEKEKEKAIVELGEAKKKLDEALAARKQVEDSSELEKLRAIELEQESAHKKEEELKKELESLKNQHESDKIELERVKGELTQALIRVDDTNKISETHVQKAEILSSELTRLKELLDSRSKEETSHSDETMLKLRSEVDALKEETNKARNLETAVSERDASIKQLNMEMEALKKAKLGALESAEELRNKVEELEFQLEEQKKSEKRDSKFLEAATRQLQESKKSLEEAQSEIAALEEKLEFSERTNVMQREDLEEFQSKLNTAEEEAARMVETIESLKSDLETKSERVKGVEDEKFLQDLIEEKDRLKRQLKISKEEEEKSKKAMESLASALHEVSTEARDLKERLFSSGHGDYEHYEMQIEDLKLVIKATNEKYENLLEDARHQIDVLTCAVEHTKYEFENSKTKWEEKEIGLLNRINKAEEELPAMQRDINRLSNMLKWSEEDARGARKEQTELRDSLKEVEDEVIYLQETLGETKSECMKLKGELQDKKTELQNFIQANKELSVREAESLNRIEELTRQLEDANKVNKASDDNGEFTDIDKDYDLVPKIEFSEENGHKNDDEKNRMEFSPTETASSEEESPQEDTDSSKTDIEHAAAVHADDGCGMAEEEMENRKDDSSVEVIFKMWETSKIDKKEALLEDNTEQKLPEDEAGSKLMSRSESFENRNGFSSQEASDGDNNIVTNEQQLKKKQPFMKKFGNLLKKKGNTTQK